MVTVEDWILEMRQFKYYHPFLFQNKKDAYLYIHRLLSVVVAYTVLKAKSYFDRL
jgi:hypothetical protein